MSRFMLRRQANKDFSILHVVNFFVATRIMSLQESLPLVKAFHSRGEDVTVTIPDEFDPRFREMLEKLNCIYEEV